MMKYLPIILMLLIVITGCAPVSNAAINQQKSAVAVDNTSIPVPTSLIQSRDDKTSPAINTTSTISFVDALRNIQDSTVLIFSTNQYLMDEAKDAFWYEVNTSKPVLSNLMPPVHWNENKLFRVWRQGSGALIDKRGYIITNRIAIEDCVSPCGTLGGITTMAGQSGAQLIYVFMSENGQFNINPDSAYIATVICKNPHEDMAILKIMPRGKDFPYLLVGDSNLVKVGQNVRAVGYPADILSFEEYRKYDYKTDTVSYNIDVAGGGGTISAQRKWDTYPYNYTMEEQENKYSANVFQVDFEINRGNCGGPLINQSGEMIGLLITKLIYQNGVGHAIAINEAKDLITAALARPIDGIPNGAFLSCSDNGYCCSESALLASPEKRCEVLCNKYYSQVRETYNNCSKACKDNTR